MILSTTIVLIAFASIVSGQTLQFVENDKICTAWQLITGEQVTIDTSPCSSAPHYELVNNNNMQFVRFCCTYRQVAPPVVGPTPSGCGRSAVTPVRTRIVGGQEAAPHSWPWLVSLQYYGSHFCGGTLIDEYHVLTAAHCLQEPAIFNSGFTIVAGLHQRSKATQAQVQRKQIQNIVNHAAYNDNTNENDVAIIRLASPVTFNSYVNAACLPGQDPALNATVVVAGWGTTSFQGSLPDELRQADVLIMNGCENVYHYDNAKQICAGNHEYTRDSCQGDSGGPLVSEVDGKWVLNGVVSFGDECAKINRPGVYARVSYYTDWVEKVIADLSKN